MPTLQQDINRFKKKYIKPEEQYKAIKYTKDMIINPHFKIINKEVTDEKGTDR